MMALNLVTCNLISFSDVPEENRNCFEVSASMESRAEPEDFVLVSSFWPLLGFFFAQDIVGAVAKNTSEINNVFVLGGMGPWWGALGVAALGAED